jgi:TraM recognition site of TraD and TraG/Bacterial protein of unknown function (DUF853)
MIHHHLQRHHHHHVAFRNPALAVHAPNLNHVTAMLWTLALSIGIGAALGGAVLFALRRRGLRWSWALVGLPLAYCLWSIGWKLGLACLAATTAAAGFGAYTHQEASQHGGEDARKMAESIGPLRWVWGKVSNRRAFGARVKDGTLAIGTDTRGRVCRIPFGIDQGVHGLIVGATGAGKTVTQAAIAVAHILAGHPVIALDPKGDRFLRRVLEAAARLKGVRFRHWSPSGDSTYNPLARGNPTEIADKALAGHRWSEPHYELATHRLLLHVLPTLKEAGMWPPTLSQLAAHMDPEKLEDLAGKTSESNKERVNSYLDSLDQRGRSDLGGGRDRLAVLADSELGPKLDPRLGGEGEEIDLAAALSGGEVLYFHLDSDRYPAASKLLASALVIDLIGLTADLQGGEMQGLLMIDEFAALAADQVSRLFARARSAGLSLLLGCQSLADLRAARPDDSSDTLTEQVLGNVACLVVHRIADPDSAERLARVGGTTPSWSITQRVSGNGTMWGQGEGTRTREREFVVLPDQFKRLGVGEAVVIDPGAKRQAQVVKIWPPSLREG